MPGQSNYAHVLKACQSRLKPLKNQRLFSNARLFKQASGGIFATPLSTRAAAVQSCPIYRA